MATVKDRWPSARLRDLVGAHGDAQRAFLEMTDEDREAGVQLIREARGGVSSVVGAKANFFRVFGWVPSMVLLAELGIIND